MQFILEVVLESILAFIGYILKTAFISIRGISGAVFKLLGVKTENNSNQRNNENFLLKIGLFCLGSGIIILAIYFFQGALSLEK